MSKTKPKIGCYCRVSTADRQKNGTQSQREAIRQWAKNNHIPTTELKWFEDRITGTTTDRPQLQKLQWAIDKGRIDCVTVFRLDRLARNTQDGLRLLSQWAEKGIKVVSVSEGISWDDSTSRLIASILLSVSTWERESIVSRIKSGMAAAKAAGKCVGRPRNEQRLARIRKMKDEGKTVIQIAKTMGITRQAVYSALARSA